MAASSAVWKLPREGNVHIHIFNMQGQQVQQLVNTYRESGYYRADWNGRDDKNRPIASGVYFYRMIVRDRKKNKVLFSKIRVMRLMR